MQHSQDYYFRNMTRPMMGVVLTVQVADSVDNHSSTLSQVFRGARHEATVQIVNDGYGGTLKLERVMLTTATPSGLGDYEEHLPRGSSQYVGGDTDPSMVLNDLYDLDGDWCIVEYIGGDLDKPYISRYIPHPRNWYDPQTCGEGEPDASGNGTTLNQQGRVYKRTHGVEYTVTPAGDVYFDTTRAGYEYKGDQKPKNGRPPMLANAEGGNARVVLKENAIVELSWTKPGDGEGIAGSITDYLAQTNPVLGNRAAAKRNKSYVQLDKDSVYLEIPSSIGFKTRSFSVQSTNITTSGDTVSVDAAEEVIIASSHVVLGVEDSAQELQWASASDTAAAEYPAVKARINVPPAGTNPGDMIADLHGKLVDLAGIVETLINDMQSQVTTETKAS